jgi:ribosomal protein L25 (general stress protein Ctc)
MEKLKDFFLTLSDENRTKIPATIYGVKKVSSAKVKWVSNTINKTVQYGCEPYYKPITQIVDFKILRLKKSEKA